MGLTVNGDTRIAASCTAESVRTDGSDPYTHKGHRVSDPSLVCLLFGWPWMQPAGLGGNHEEAIAETLPIQFFCCNVPCVW